MKDKPVIKRFGNFFLMLAIILVVSTCKQKLFKKINYSGTAYDHTSGQPLTNTKIELKACGGGSGDKSVHGCEGNQFTIGSATTDGAGHFSISGKAARSDIYYVNIVYNGTNNGAFSDGVSASRLNSEYSTIYLYH